MTFDEALRVLAIEVSVGEEGARRAYLRLIKIHKPDRDPEAFRRVREAFDRVKGEIGWRAAILGGGRPAPAPRPPPAEPIWEGATEGDPAEDASADGPEAEVPAPTEVPTSALEVPAATPPEAPPAVVEPPGAPEVVEPPADEAKAHLDGRYRPNRHILLDKVPELLKIVDQPPVVRGERPVPMLVVNERPGLRFGPVEQAPPPPRPTPEPPRRTPAEWLEAARQRLEAGDEQGIDDALAAFEAARRWPEAPEPEPTTALHLVLVLFAECRPGDARRLFAALRGWLLATGAERRLMGGQVAARLAVVRALADLPPDTPPRPAAIIARATLEEALEGAQAGLRAFAQESPYSASLAAAHFEAHAPLLAGAFAPALRTVVEAPAPGRFLAGRLKAFLWVGLALIAIRGLATCLDDRPHADRYGPPAFTYQRYEPPRFTVPTLPPLDPAIFRMRPLPELPDLRPRVPQYLVDDLCGSPLAQKNEQVCPLVVEAVADAEGGRCAGLADRLKRLDAATAKQRRRRPPEYALFQTLARGVCEARVAPPAAPEQNESVPSTEVP